MFWRFPSSERTFSTRHSRGTLLSTPLGIVVFLLLLIYVFKDFQTSLVVNAEACSANCTLYASPSGNDSNSGTTPSSPKTFLGAAAATRPGSVVCFLAGSYPLSSSFSPPASGKPSAWIVYKNCGDGPVYLVWTGAADAEPMIKINGGKFPSQPSYLEFRGLNLDGQGNALDGFFCMGSHHLRFIGNTITNTGGAGIASVSCDYLTADHNIVHHNGYIPPHAGSDAQYYSWTSGISFNSNQWYDRYAGFHNIIANNIVSGEVDQSPKHTDGNGIILDLSNRTYDYSSANTPPALVINNVVYGNGGRCIEAFTVTNFWIVNNTCYKNVLDFPGNTATSVTVNNSRDGYVINNLAVVGESSGPCYGEENTAENIRYFRNLCFGSSMAARVPKPSQFILADPLFVCPPDFHPATVKQGTETLSAQLLGDRLTLLPGSPALQKGIDPSSLPQFSKDIVGDLEKYVYTDFAGKPRPQGGPFDLGAYQASALPAR